MSTLTGVYSISRPPVTFYVSRLGLEHATYMDFFFSIRLRGQILKGFKLKLYICARPEIPNLSQICMYKYSLTSITKNNDMSTLTGVNRISRPPVAFYVSRLGSEHATYRDFFFSIRLRGPILEGFQAKTIYLCET